MGEIGKIYDEVELRQIVEDSIDIHNGDYRANPEFCLL